MTGIRTVYEYSYEDRVSPRHFRGFKSEGVVQLPKFKRFRWFHRNNNKIGCSDPPVKFGRSRRRNNNKNKKASKKHQQRWQPPKLVIDKSLVEEEGTRIGNYELEMLLGEGGWGSVYLATTTSSYEEGDDEDDDVAIKVLPRFPKKGETVVDMAYYQRSIALEASILQNHGTNHPNIIGYHETLCTPNNVYLVMETATVNLGTMIYNMDYIYDQSDFRQQVMTGILRGVHYLHSKGIAHCDIKPENIVLVAPHALVLVQEEGDDDEENGENTTYRFKDGGRIEACDVRLIDFGIAHTSKNYCGNEPVEDEADSNNSKKRGGGRRLLRSLIKRSSSSSDAAYWDTRHDIPMTHGAGTTHWKAPETNEYGYEARRADIWSCGAILVRLFLLLKRDTDWCCQTIMMSSSPSSSSSKDCSSFGRGGEKTNANDDPCWTLVSKKLKRTGIDPQEEIPLLYDFLSNYLLPFNPQRRATAQTTLQHSWLQLQPEPCMENRQVDKVLELRAAAQQHQQQQAQ